MRRQIRYFLVLSLLLFGAGCGTDGGDLEEADLHADDLSAEADFLDEDLPQNPQEVVADGLATETLTLTGRVLDETGEPVTKAMLVLCGEVEGLAVCIQQFAEDDGTFQYTELLQGYTHLQVMPHLAAAQSGLLYAGISFITDLPAPPATYDWGDIVLPIVEQTVNLVVADGGLLELGALSLELAPASANFPDLNLEGPVGVVRAAADQIPEGFEGEAAYAFYPFDTRLNEASTVRIPVDSLTDVWDGEAPVQVFVNSTDLGGLYEVDAAIEEGDLVFDISELTWIVLAFD